jgi:hypothetical protein
MLKISWLEAAAQLVIGSVGFFTRALGRSETQQID